MNTTRRRPPSSAFTDRAYYSTNDRGYTSSRSYSPLRAEVTHQSSNDDSQGKLRKHKSTWSKVVRHFSSRRLWDVLLILGGSVKLISVLYSRQSQSHNLSSRNNHLDARQWERHLHTPSSTTSTTEAASIPSKQSWIKRIHKLVFHTPILFRFNEDTKFNINKTYRGMFRSKHLSDSKSASLNENGYAIVDDVIYYSDDRRGRTNWALHASECQVQQPHDENTIEIRLNSPHSIRFSNHEPKQEQQFYIDDAGEWDAYYAFDDDHVRSAKGTGLHEKRPAEEVKKQQCMRPDWYSIYYPTCNEIHANISGEAWMIGEESLMRSWTNGESSNREKKIPRSKYLGSGYYRNAFLLERSFVAMQSQGSKSHNNHHKYNNNNHKASIEYDKVVFKSMKQLDDKTTSTNDDDASEYAYDPTDKYSYVELIEDMRKDAMVMERLTSSPRSADIYSYCGLSSVIEFAPVDIEEYIMPSKGRHAKLIRQYADPEDYGLDMEYPVNDYISPQEKLEIALEMAKCLAEMHGYVGGPIAHVDVQAGQFFRGKDGFIKLVDFNRAEALLYDIKQDAYCKFVNGPPAEGMFRAPEENIDEPLTEKIDIYSLGNVLYSVLTGIMVHSERSSHEAHQRIVEGKTEPIADSYYEEPSLAALAEVIELCWTYDVEERPSIFEVVQVLEGAVKTGRLQNWRKGKLR